MNFKCRCMDEILAKTDHINVEEYETDLREFFSGSAVQEG